VHSYWRNVRRKCDDERKSAHITITCLGGKN
jgi:hypothetical protein